MYKVLVVSHSSLCKGLIEAVEMILGEGQGVEYLSLDTDGIEIFDKNLKNKLQKLKEQSKEILVLADLFGGSPFNKVMLEAANDENIKIITGVNLGMLIEAIINNNNNINTVLENIISSAQESIKLGVISKCDNAFDE